MAAGNVVACRDRKLVQLPYLCVMTKILVLRHSAKRHSLTPGRLLFAFGRSSDVMLARASRSFVNSVVAYIPVESILHVMQVFNLEQIARSASMNNRIASEATRLTRKCIKVPSTLDTLSLNCCHFV
jgi:hypothetical protein